MLGFISFILLILLPVCVQHVPGELLSLQQQVLDGSLCLSGLSLKSCSGVRQLLSHDSVKIYTTVSLKGMTAVISLTVLRQKLVKKVTSSFRMCFTPAGEELAPPDITLDAHALQLLRGVRQAAAESLILQDQLVFLS